MSENPYEVLGVAATASDDELRHAYRRMMRRTHPDLGGSAERFEEVQAAWRVVGTRSARAAFDVRQAQRRGSSAPGARTARPAGTGGSASSGRAGNAAGSAAPSSAWPGSGYAGPAAGPSSAAGSAGVPPRAARPTARMYGHPGGRARDRFALLMREWVGRGEGPVDIYDETLIARAPSEIRHALADAQAEEATATALGELDLEHTVWHGVMTGRGSDSWVVDADAADSDTRKIDHVVLGPTGLFALQSEDWDAAATPRRHDLTSAGLGKKERPVRALAERTKAVARSARVRFDAIAIVLPDDDLEQAVTSLGRVKGMEALAVRRSAVLDLVRGGVPSAGPVPDIDVFDVRERLQRSIRLI